MEIFLSVIFGLVALGAVTVIGHGIWMLIAGFFQGLSGRDSRNQDQHAKTYDRKSICTQCGRSLWPLEIQCPTCGLERGSLVADELRDLEATARQLATFRAAGSVDGDTYERLEECVKTRRRLLTAARLLPSQETSAAPAGELAAAPAPSSASKVRTLSKPAKDEILEVLPVDDGAEVAKPGPASLPQAPAARPSRTIATPVPKVPPTPRRSLAEILAAFMEERNIFWGELVGGLLMVGCSIALVIYLWKDLEKIAYFKFLIFVGTTALVFGAGLYALYRLKLQTTGRGLFVIAMLLVPLNFLVMAGLTKEQQQGEPGLRVGMELLALAVFAGLLQPAAKAFMPQGRWALILAVLGISVSPLAVPRLLSPGQSEFWPLILLGSLPVACYAVSAGSVLARLTSRATLDEAQAKAVFAFLGLAVFPLLVALGFLVYWTEATRLALEWLAVHIVFAGIPILAGGLVVQRRLSTAPGQDGEQAAALRTIGTAVALAGMAIMLLAVFFAWPQPWGLILVCLLNFAVLTAIALVYQVPVAHGAALPCLAIGYLTAFHLLLGHLEVPAEALGQRLVEMASSAQSGSALVVLVFLTGGMATALGQLGGRAHAVMYAAGSGVLALVSLALVSVRGVESPGTAAVVTGIYAVSILAVNLSWRRPLLSYFGLVLVLATTLWALWWRNPAVTPSWSAIMAGEALIMGALAVWAAARIPTPQAWRDVASGAGLLAFLLACMALDSSAWHTGTAGILAAAALVLAWAYRSAFLSWVGSAMLLACLLHALVWRFTGLELWHPAAVALLSHATLVLIASLTLKARRVTGLSRRLFLSVVRIIARPLYQTALVTSLVALPITFALAWGEMAPLAVYMGWLSALWLVIALTSRRPAMFAAFQAALTLTCILGISAWLEGQPWMVRRVISEFLDTRSLQAYGIGLGVLSLFWVVTRLALRGRTLAQKLLEPPWPAVDRVVLGMVVVGQLAVAVGTILPGVAAGLGNEISIFPSADTFGIGAWFLLLILAVVLLISLWDRQPAAAVFGLLILAVTVPVLIAGRFDSVGAAEPALRWGLALCYIACSLGVWFREGLGALAARIGWAKSPENAIAMPARRLLLLLAVLPVLSLTAAFAVVIFVGSHASTLSPDSFFAHIGVVASTVIPLVLISIGLVGHALRERAASYVFTAGLVVNAAVMVGYALGIVSAGQVFREVEFVRLVQLGGITAAVWALAWLASRRWVAAWREDPANSLARPLMIVQLGLAAIGSTALLSWPLAELVLHPAQILPADPLAVGDLYGWLALFLAAGACFWYVSSHDRRQCGHVFAAFGLALGVLAACSSSRLDVSGEWLAYHVLTAAWIGTGLAILAAEYVAKLRDGQIEEFSPFPLLARFLLLSTKHYHGWLNVLAVLVLGLALRGTWEDPLRPYWPAGATLAVSAMAGAVALRARLPKYVYFSGILINVAGSMVWVAWGSATLFSFGYTQALCFALASTVWSALELVLQANPANLEPKTQLPRFRHVAFVLAISLLAILVPSALAIDVSVGVVVESVTLPWLALGTVAVALAILLWDREARFCLGGAYAIGLLAVGLALDTAQLGLHDLRWIGTLALSGYVMLVSLLVWATPRLREFWRGFQLPDWPARGAQAWFAPAHTTTALAVVALSIQLSLSFTTLEERLAAPLAIAILIPAGIYLVRGMPDDWGRDLRFATLAAGVVLLTVTGWVTLIDPADYTAWLHRNVLLMVALALTTLAYGVGLSRLLPSLPTWAESGRRIGPMLGVSASAVLLVVLAQESWFYDSNTQRTDMTLWAIVIVAVAHVGLIAAGLSFAVVPGKDPLGLSERGRTMYVYAGEILLALLCLHFRLTVPEIFRLGIVTRCWTFLIMAIAFLGVGLSEFFNRRGLRVLAEPLQRTGVFLPLLPVLTFWVIPLVRAEQEQLAEPELYGKYALLWFLVGSLYSVVALNRRSPRYGLFAALAANAGLWAFLFYNHLQFLTHPQMWLIPLSIIALVAEHLNRDRLSEQQSNTLRYLALLVLYVSSTADMFIAGLGNSVVWPLVLAILSVVGVLAGILFHVRAFMYLGVTFLFVVIFSMIWHAAVGQGQMWVWWVSGIVLGAAIITLFAIFEQRRNDVLRVIEEIKKWD